MAKKDVVIITDTPMDKINAISMLSNMVLMESCATELEKLKVKDRVDALQESLWAVQGKEPYRQAGQM